MTRTNEEESDASVSSDTTDVSETSGYEETEKSAFFGRRRYVKNPVDEPSDEERKSLQAAVANPSQDRAPPGDIMYFHKLADALATSALSAEPRGAKPWISDLEREAIGEVYTRARDMPELKETTKFKLTGDPTPNTVVTVYKATTSVEKMLAQACSGGGSSIGGHRPNEAEQCRNCHMWLTRSSYTHGYQLGAVTHEGAEAPLNRRTRKEPKLKSKLTRRGSAAHPFHPSTA